jgi:hypothetical protein
MSGTSIFLIASDTNLRLSLGSILERSQFAVKNLPYLCAQEVESQAVQFALFVYAIRSTYDARLASAYLQDETCLAAPIIFLCEPVFAPLLQQATRHCCRVEILITPLAPERIIASVHRVLNPPLINT